MPLCTSTSRHKVAKSLSTPDHYRALPFTRFFRVGTSWNLQLRALDGFQRGVSATPKAKKKSRRGVDIPQVLGYYCDVLSRVILGARTLFVSSCIALLNVFPHSRK